MSGLECCDREGRARQSVAGGRDLSPAPTWWLLIFALPQELTDRPRHHQQQDHTDQRKQEWASHGYMGLALDPVGFVFGPVSSLTIMPTPNTTTAPIRLYQRNAIEVFTVT